MRTVAEPSQSAVCVEIHAVGDVWFPGVGVTYTATITTPINFVLTTIAYAVSTVGSIVLPHWFNGAVQALTMIPTWHGRPRIASGTPAA